MTPRCTHGTFNLVLGFFCGLFWLAWGGPGGSGLARAADGQSLAVFAIPTDNFSEKAAAMINHVARENFGREAQFSIKDVRAFFEEGGEDARQKSLEQARKFMAKGKEQYDNLELDAAVDELTKATTEFEKAVARLGNGQEYLEALLYLGAAYILSGDTDRAGEAFRKVAMYDRRKTLDPKLFPPSMIEIFNKVKDEVGSAPTGTLLAKSSPSGGEIYLNGVFKGITPYQLIKVPEGKHFLRIEKDGYAPWGHTVEFFATHEETLEANLKPTAQLPRLSGDAKKFLEDLDDDPPSNDVIQFGRWLGVQRLVLVSVKQRGDEVNAEASLIQLEPAKLISNKSVTLNLLSSNFLTQADAFITSLYRTVNIPPAEGGKKGDGPVAQVHCNTDTDCTSGEVCDTASARCIPYAPEADRFYQKWWFWAILGGSLAVAGGTGVLIWYFTQPQRGAIEFTF